MAIEQWQIDSRRHAGWSENEIAAWIASASSAVGNQSGSQFWMNNNYQGAEPPQEVKQAFSSADYARDWITGYSQVLVSAGVPVSDAVKTIAKNPITTNPGQMWDQFPDTSPIVAAAARYPTFVTAMPESFNDPTHPLAPVSPVSGAGAGTVDPYQAIVKSGLGGGALMGLDGPGGTAPSGDTGSGGSALSGILNAGLLIPVAIVGLFLVLVYMATKGSGSSASA
jgi:hypothetical protein